MVFFSDSYDLVDFHRESLRTYSSPLKTVARPSKSWGSRTQTKLPAFAKSKGTVTFRLNYSQSYAITKMQLGRSLWREERHSITCIISAAAAAVQVNTKHHIILLLVFLSGSWFSRKKKKKITAIFCIQPSMFPASKLVLEFY